MSGKRKLFMFFGQLVAAAVLVGVGKLAGAEFVSLEVMAIPVFVAGNFGEHFTQSSRSAGGGDAKNTPPV